LTVNRERNIDQALLLEMDHIGSTSVEGMYAKPIIDILLVRGQVRENYGATTYDETIDTLVNLGYTPKHKRQSRFTESNTLIKEGFIIHCELVFSSEGSHFIVLREYLRAHADARDKYNEYKKRLLSNTKSIIIKEYTSRKDRFLDNLMKEAINWYHKNEKYVHIGDLDQKTKQWSCCNALEREGNSIYAENNSYKYGPVGCCQPGLKTKSYHPGRYCVTEYNFVRGWWTCCSQGQNSIGCVKVRALANGDGINKYFSFCIISKKYFHLAVLVLLNDCEKWGIDSVCRWVQSLVTINIDYSSHFRQQGITGHVLLTIVDDAILQDLGVSSLLHRRLFVKAIQELKVSLVDVSSKKMTTTTTKKVFYDQFEGDFAPIVSVSEMENDATTIYENVLACQLTNEKHRTIISHVSNWLGILPSCYKIDFIEYVFNAGRYRMFLGQLEAIENRQKDPAFQPKLNEESNFSERCRVLARLDALCEQVSHNRNVRIVRMWHGCRRNALSSLLSHGFATLGTLDDGWYGKAMYFTSSAKYATRYCDVDGDGCLIMCYIILLNPFPVISADAPLNVSPTKFRFYGRGNHKNYQCHYIPVSPVSTASTMDYRPPSTGIDDAIYDELAVFQETCILPQFVVHLKS